MTEKEKIGIRLEEWAKGKFGEGRGWVVQFAQALGLDTSGARKYLSGKVVPGTKMQAKLRKLGCSIEWLMTGRKKESENEAAKEEWRKYLDQVAFRMTGMPVEQRDRIVELIKKLTDANTNDAETISRIIDAVLRPKK